MPLIATMLAASASHAARPPIAVPAAATAGSASASASASATLPSPERRQQLLFEAARLGRTDMIDPLVKAGADLNAYDDRGFTPLILAAYNGQLAMVEVLIGRGADACRPDRDQGNTAQMGVAFKGEDAIAARLLKAGCNVDARNNAGQTALMMASLFNRTCQVDMLLAAGADRAIRDTAGRSAGSVASDQGNTPMAARVGH
ncbi:ankyrin repeat domain-containing protein [uncultured Sphingomonas sp.]|uniref:ankyrin repeat domain-containing protein n=1 Tax=uncultured Sphingomonas sp. TaxID=158754 RepID=UPI0025D1AB80|nr:ankyrin repeat domain-containing protein [uncultured Sphingomonas sp.]